MKIRHYICNQTLLNAAYQLLSSLGNSGAFYTKIEPEVIKYSKRSEKERMDEVVK